MSGLGGMVAQGKQVALDQIVQSTGRGLNLETRCYLQDGAHTSLDLCVWLHQLS